MQSKRTTTAANSGGSGLFAANMDKSQSIQQLLKSCKIISELQKGVATMQACINPSVLQAAAIPIIRKEKGNAEKNIIVKYAEMSGIKLTVLVPVLDRQIRHAVTKYGSQEERESGKMTYSLILCHSNGRCQEWVEFAQQLLTFCQDVLDIVHFDDCDESDIKIWWKKQQQLLGSEAQSKEVVEPQKIQVRNKLIIMTPLQARTLYGDGSILTSNNSECFGFVLDKVNLHQAFDLDQDLLDLAKLKSFPRAKNLKFKMIFTTNVKEEVVKDMDEEMTENFNQIKKTYMGPKDKGGKALIIQLNEDQRTVTKVEQLNHYYSVCRNTVDKYLLLFALKKLGMIEGKLLIYANSVVEAYRIKFFFSRFQMKAFVLSPDMAQQQLASVIHYFTIGQFDILVTLHSNHFPKPLPQIKQVNWIINFDLPESYKQYRESAQQIENENGAVINFQSPDQEKKQQNLQQIQKKMVKLYNRSDMLRFLPVIWHEVERMKSRVEDIVRQLTNKKVLDEKLVEFKKQIVSNKSLKQYFKNNPQEKEILQNDISKKPVVHKKQYSHLKALPYYCIPSHIIAVTEEQRKQCTAGTGFHNQTSDSTSGNLSVKHRLEYILGGLQLVYADADEANPDNKGASSVLMENLLQFPAAAEQFHQRGASLGGNEATQGGKEDGSNPFAYEQPDILSYEALEPTSGRKQWMLKHGKRIKKKLKADKRGYIGS